MSGGFLSQSVVTPEIDGAIRPFALFAQYKDDEGLQHSFAVPERLETFVNTVNNYLTLKTKPNSEKAYSHRLLQRPRTKCPSQQAEWK